MNSLKIWIEELSKIALPSVYNPWGEYDLRYDRDSSVVNVRCAHLEAYLSPRLRKSKYVIIAEAMGYQGGHFSGIAMTCERMLLGHHKGVHPSEIFPLEYLMTHPLMRTSSSDRVAIPQEIQRKKGFNEPTDTVVWAALKENGINPFDVILWNIFPFHPYRENNLLSNRTPSEEELRIGWNYTQQLLSMHGQASIFAVGRKAQEVLQKFGVEAIGLRHPANGGVKEYKEGFKNAL